MATEVAQDTLDGLRGMVRAVTGQGVDYGIRVDRARMVVEQAADMRDFARLAAASVGGSRAVDLLRAWHIEYRLHVGGTPSEVERAAGDRIRAREVADQLRVTQVTADTPGILPRPTDLGTASTGIGDGLPLIRRLALERDFTQGGTKPVTPGIPKGSTVGTVNVEGVAPAPGPPITIADVGATRARIVSSCTASLSHQSVDWLNDAEGALLDQVFLDVADRGAETYIGGQIVAAPGAGTRVAGADAATLATALDAAESAAGAAVMGGESAGLVLLANPANLPKIRRAVAASWQPGLPQPVLMATIGLAAGTAAVVALDGLHLLRHPIEWQTAEDPMEFGITVGAHRPFYFAVREATAVQLVTAIPA